MWIGCRVEGPASVETYAGFGGDVGLGNVGEDFFSAMLGEGDVDGGGLAAELDVLDCEGCWAYFRTLWEFKVDGEGVRLVLFSESGVEVRPGDAEEARCHIATVRNCISVSRGSGLVNTKNMPRVRRGHN